MAQRRKLFVHQYAFLQAPFLYPDIRFHFLIAGYGAGKSRGLAATILYLLKELQGKKDVAGDGPRILVGGASINHFITTTLVYVLEDLDNSKSKYYWDSKHNTLSTGNVTMQVVSLSNPGSIKGQDVCVCLADEADDLSDSQGAEDLTFEAIKALNERARQMVIGFRKPYIAVATTSQGQKGLYRVVTQFKKSGQGFTLVRGRTADNLYLDPDYVKSLYKNYSKSERLVFLEGFFLALASGRVFGDFDWDRNYVHTEMDQSIYQDEHLIWAQDFNQGYHRGCVMTERKGIVYIVKEYEFPDMREAAMVVRTDFPRAKITWVPDATSNDQISSFRKELNKYGIRWAMRKKNPAVEDTVFLVNKLLYSRRLIATAMARETAEDMARALRDKNNAVPPGKGPNSPIHRCDGVRMACHYLAITRPSLRDIRRITIERHMKMREEEAEVVEEGGGYVTVSAGALR